MYKPKSFNATTANTQYILFCIELTLADTNYHTLNKHMHLIITSSLNASNITQFITIQIHLTVIGAKHPVLKVNSTVLTVYAEFYLLVLIFLSKKSPA